MQLAAKNESVSAPAPALVAAPVAGLRTLYFTLEAINALATAYYFNYIFFYMRDHFGFGNRSNLMLTATHGFVYMFSAWNAGRIGHKHGYRLCLGLGFSGMALALTLGGLAPRFFGYSHRTMAMEFGVLALWSISMCLTWPTLQALISRDQTPVTMPRAAGLYNVIWAGASAVAYLTGGALMERFGGETLFWLPVGLHLTELALLARVPKAGAAETFQPAAESADEPIQSLNPRPIAKARTFLYLAWLANPFAYMAINGVLPVIPKLSAKLGLDDAHAGVVCSVWFWARFGSFIWFWLWPGWHYRFRWLLGAFIALAGSFTLMLLSWQVWVLVAAQVVFGLAVGLAYYSSLFYSMDVGESQGKRGGVHEAAIGFGVFSGPAIGVAALYMLPSHPNAGTWAISSVLLLGLIPFLLIKCRAARGRS
jgi:MFS family permease